MTYFLVKQIAAPTPEAFRSTADWATGQSLESWLIARVAELGSTSRDTSNATNWRGTPFVWSSERRNLIRAELDAAMFHLYGFDRADVDYILDTFPIVKRKDEAKYGEFRTKRLILEVYDRMAEAIRTGEPYQTVLDPPAGEGPRTVGGWR